LAFVWPQAEAPRGKSVTQTAPSPAAIDVGVPGSEIVVTACPVSVEIFHTVLSLRFATQTKPESSETMSTGSFPVGISRGRKDRRATRRIVLLRDVVIQAAPAARAILDGGLAVPLELSTRPARPFNSFAPGSTL